MTRQLAVRPRNLRTTHCDLGPCRRESYGFLSRTRTTTKEQDERVRLCPYILREVTSRRLVPSALRRNAARSISSSSSSSSSSSKLPNAADFKGSDDAGASRSP